MPKVNTALATIDAKLDALARQRNDFNLTIAHLASLRAELERAYRKRRAARTSTPANRADVAALPGDGTP